MGRAWLVLFLLTVIFFAASPVSGAATHRLTPEEVREKEKKITKKMSEQIERQIPEFKDQKAEAKLSLLTARLRPHMSRDLDYEVRILNREDPHAFSLPGGLTYVTSAMLQFIRGDDEMAAVLAREFVHSDRSHWLTQSARNDKFDLTKMAEVAAATQSGKVAGGVVSSYLNRAVINFYDGDLEREADMMAMEIMLKAGYDRVAMLTFLERMRVERLKHIHVKGIDIRYKSGFQPFETVLDTVKFSGKESSVKDADLSHSDMIRTAAEMGKRVELVHEHFRKNMIEIKRKHVVNRLLTDVKESEGGLVLTVDDALIVKANRTEEHLVTLERYKAGIDERLQLETPPFDIRIQRIGDYEALLVGGRPLIYRDDLGEREPDLGHVREVLIEVLSDARRENFLTDYYD